MAMKEECSRRNSTVQVLSLENNLFTENGLPHVTRLLQRQTPLRMLKLDRNPELFHNEENTELFSSAVSRTATIRNLSLHFCHLPDHVITAIFQAVANNPKLKTVYALDSVQPQGQTLERQLEIIPNMKVTRLYVNLDFEDESVLSSFHRNARILHLHSSEDHVEISNGPVNGKLERNR
jgi:hypothetical protein